MDDSSAGWTEYPGNGCLYSLLAEAKDVPPGSQAALVLMLSVDSTRHS